MTASASAFAIARAELSPLGLTILPALPHDLPRPGAGKAPGHFSGGGWSGIPGWSKYAETGVSSFLQGMWERMPGANAGFLTGTSAGRDAEGNPLQLVVLDFDCSDPDDLAVLLASALPSPAEKRGRVGLSRLYRASREMKSKAYDSAKGGGRLLDLLAAGRFCVSPPSTHPKSGLPYVWTQGPVAVSELPILTSEDLEQLEEALQLVGWEPQAETVRVSAGPRVERVRGEYDNVWAETNGEALARLAEWFPLLNLPGTRQSRAGVFSAVPVWRPSGSGRPTEIRKSNLSASSGLGGIPAGIRDWAATGADASLTAIDLVQRALDMDAPEAMGWLRETLGLDDDDSGVVIDLVPCVTSDHDLPEPLRPRSESKTAPFPAGTGAEAVPLAVLGRAGEDCPTSAKLATHAIPTEMPAHLLEVPGLVGEILDYVVASARKPQPVLALATALTVVGTCGGRRYAGPTGSGTHLYCIAAAKSGAAKDHGLDMAVRLLTAAEMTQHVGKGEWMSFQAVYKALNRQPLSLNCLDELGGFLKRINKRSSGGNEQAITAILRTAWGKSFKMLPPPEWAGQDYEPIWSPALSILGASTHEEFFRALEAGDTDNGFLNRWLLFSTQTRPAVQKPTADIFAVPASIVAGMKAIYQGGNPLVNATMHSGRCDRPEITVEWADGEDGALNAEYLAWAEQLDEASDAESFFARTAEQALRLATIRAMGCFPVKPVIDRACFAWGKEVSLWCTNRMLLDAREFMAENQTQSDRAKVVRAIRSNSPLTQRDLLRKLTGFKARELEEITKALEAAELIRVELGPLASNNKRSKIYHWLGEG
jgi:hypothetical protein